MYIYIYIYKLSYLQQFFIRLAGTQRQRIILFTYKYSEKMGDHHVQPAIGAQHPKPASLSPQDLVSQSWQCSGHVLSLIPGLLPTYRCSHGLAPVYPEIPAPLSSAQNLKSPQKSTRLSRLLQSPQQLEVRSLPVGTTHRMWQVEWKIIHIAKV